MKCEYQKQVYEIDLFYKKAELPLEYAAGDEVLIIDSNKPCHNCVVLVNDKKNQAFVKSTLIKLSKNNTYRIESILNMFQGEEVLSKIVDNLITVYRKAEDDGCLQLLFNTHTIYVLDLTFIDKLYKASNYRRYDAIKSQMTSVAKMCRLTGKLLLVVVNDMEDVAGTLVPDYLVQF